MNIILIGFPSSGKSTIGPVLSMLIGYSYRDLDTVIEEIFFHESGEKRICREIYHDRGDGSFRDLQHRALQSLRQIDTTVLATGGSAPIDPRNKSLLVHLGAVVYLFADVATLWARLQKRGIPAFQQSDPSLEHLTAVWESRDPVYRELSQFVIDTSTLSPDMAAQRIADRVLHTQSLFDRS